MGSHEVKIPDKGSIQCVRGTNEFMAAEHKKLTDEISDFTRATLFEENTTWTVFCSVSEHPQRISTVIWKGCWQSFRRQLHFHLCEASFPSYTSVKTSCYERLNAETDMPIQLFINPDITETGKILKQRHFYHWFFFFGKNSYFHNFTYVHI